MIGWESFLLLTTKSKSKRYNEKYVNATLDDSEGSS